LPYPNCVSTNDERTAKRVSTRWDRNGDARDEKLRRASPSPWLGHLMVSRQERRVPADLAKSCNSRERGDRDGLRRAPGARPQGALYEDTQFQGRILKPSRAALINLKRERMSGRDMRQFLLSIKLLAALTRKVRDQKWRHIRREPELPQHEELP